MKDSRRRFSVEEYQARQHKTRRAMEQAGIDVLLTADPANMYWLTGYDSWSFYVHQFVVIATDGTLFWFGRGMDAAGVKLTTDLSEADTVAYSDHYVQSAEVHPAEYLAEVLAARGLAGKRTGVEKDSYYFTARAMESLVINLPEANFIDCTTLVRCQRAVKSKQEIDYIRIAGKIIERTYQRVLEVAQPGMRKNELAAEILHTNTWGTSEYWGDYTAIVPLMGVGEEASASHMTWDGNVIEKDTGMFLELAAAHARYHCPCSRTIYFGKPTQQYRDIEKAIVESITNTLEAFRPGNTCGEVAGVFLDSLERLGYAKDSRCGYSIGIGYPPDWGEHSMSLRRSDTTVLEEGMCFHFMPGMWFDDWGFEITQALTVTSSGGECLSDVPRQLFVID